MKNLIYLLIVLLSFSFIACSEDNSVTETEETTEAWVGTWLSAGENVATTITSLGIDSVRVTFNENKTILLYSHVAGGAWAETSGTYSVTKSSSGDIHSINIVYAAYEQAGIIQVISGSPDQMKLEVIQSVPAISFAPRTPETGFGSDVALGEINIQTYVRVD